MSALGWGLAIGGVAAAIGGIVYVVKIKPAQAKGTPSLPKSNPNAAPPPPAGTTWKKVIDGVSGGVIPQGAYLLMEWNDSSAETAGGPQRTAAQIATDMQKPVAVNGFLKPLWTVFASWEPGNVPDGWPTRPGATSDPSMVRVYARTEQPVSWPANIDTNGAVSNFTAFGATK